MKTPVIFLDIDGVLNNEAFLKLAWDNVVPVPYGSSEPSCEDQLDSTRIGLLNELIESTGAKVVLSSTWRFAVGVKRTTLALERRGFRGNIIGSTPRGRNRGEEIAECVQELGCTRFVILDDDVSPREVFKKRFVHVPNGLEKAHIESAKLILE